MPARGYRKCPFCGDYFKTKTGKEETCGGIQCNDLLKKQKRKNKKESQKKELTCDCKCAYCGADFKAASRSAKYCSVAHRKAAYRERSLKHYFKKKNMEGQFTTGNKLSGHLDFNKINLFGAYNSLECERQPDPYFGF